MIEDLIPKCRFSKFFVLRFTRGFLNNVTLVAVYFLQ